MKKLSLWLALVVSTLSVFGQTAPQVRDSINIKINPPLSINDLKTTLLQMNVVSGRADSLVHVITESGLKYKGSWNVTTNTPNLGALSLNSTTDVGTQYIVTVAGTIALSPGVASTAWLVGDAAVWTGAEWSRLIHSDLALAKVMAIEAKLPVINYFDVTNVRDGYLLNANGTVSTNASYSYGRGFIKVTPGETWKTTHTDGSPGTGIRRVSMYTAADSTTNVQANFLETPTNVTTSFVIPAGTNYIRPSFLTAQKPNVQVGPSVSTLFYAPYNYNVTSNIKIKGSDVQQNSSYRLPTDAQLATWTGKIDTASITTQVSKNLFIPSSATDGQVLAANGSQSANAGYGVSGFINAVAGDTISTFSIKVNKVARRVNMYSSTDVHIPGAFLEEGAGNTVTKTFIIPTTSPAVAKIKVSYYASAKPDFQVEKFKYPTTWFPYYKKITAINGKSIIIEASSTLRDSANLAVSYTEKTNWNGKLSSSAVVKVASKNLYNNDSTGVNDYVKRGKYLNSNGSEATSVNFIITKYIPVAVGQTITIYNWVRGARRVNFYTGTLAAPANVQAAALDETTPGTNTITFTVPSGLGTITYMRASIYAANEATTQIEYAAAPTDYIIGKPVAISIDGAIFPTGSTGGGGGTATDANMVFPTRLRAIVGKEFNIYYDSYNVLPEYGSGQPNYLFNITCGKGKMGYRSFQFTPVSGDLGEYLLTVNILDSYGKVTQTASTTLEVVAAANPATVKHILHFGDSRINEGTVTKTIQENLAAMGGNVPIFHGTHNAAPAQNEARSGRTWAAFRGTVATVTKFTVSGLSANYYPTGDIKSASYYHGTNTAGHTIPLLERWKIGADGTGFIVGYEPDFTLPTSFPATLTATTETLAAGFPATITINSAALVSNYSIFKNSDGEGTLDIAYYRTDVLKMASGTKFDEVIACLGTNDVGAGVSTSAINTIIDNAKAVIDAFLADNPSCKFIISFPASRSSDMFVTTRAQSAYRASMQELRKAYKVAFDYNIAYPNVYIAHAGYGIDRWYGYPNGPVTTAARIPTTVEHSNSNGDVHSNIYGYQQEGDANTGTVVYGLNLP